MRRVKISTSASVSVELRIGDTIVALLGKYATEKVLASGGIEAPDSEYLMATPQPVNSAAQRASIVSLIFIN